MGMREEGLRQIMRSYEALTGRHWLPVEVDDQKLFIEAWQASRAALVVELPTAKSPHNNEVIKAVGRSIVAQGLKVVLK